MNQPPTRPAETFRSSAERIVGEREDRADLVRRRLQYHVTYLDDLLLGIRPHDLVLIGAWTGVGKTACAASIAQANARAKRRVHFFALEAEPNEIERRIKYRLVSQLLWQHRPAVASRLRMRYVEWYHGTYDAELAVTERQAEEQFRQSYSTLRTYYRGNAFAVGDIERLFRAVQDETDLIILDHLHYVDTDDPNENRGYKEITKRIRDISIAIGRPIVVVVHLRKRDRGINAMVPTLDDVHGSSDIVKIATHAIMLAPVPRDEYKAKFPDVELRSHVAPTFLYVAKDRISGQTPYCAIAGYDMRTSAYEASYRLAMLSARGDHFTPCLDSEIPDWAKHAERVNEPPPIDPADFRVPGDRDPGEEG